LVEKGESATLEPPGIMKILVQKLTAMESRLEEVATNMMEMKEDIRTIKDDISVMKEDIRAIQEDMRTMKADMSTMKADILTLKQDFGMMKKDVSHRRAGKNTCYKDVHGLGDRMSKMEERSRRSEETLSTALGMIAFG
jgi:chromosome segregation ATPase